MKTLSDEEAIRIAEATISGKVKRVPGSPVDVARDGTLITVTFVHLVPPNMLGADYDAQIVIDARTGEVVQFKVGS